MKNYARGGGDVAEANDGVVAAEYLFGARLHDGLKMQSAGRGLVMSVIDAVREDASLQIRCKRRHCVDARHEGERVALALFLLLQECVDLRVKGFEAAEQKFFFHGLFSLC